MTSKPFPGTPLTGVIDDSPNQFPAFPPRGDMQNPIYLHRPAHLAALARHFGAPDTTLVLGEVPVGWNTRQHQGLRVPDLIIAFGLAMGRIIDDRGYSIEERGKPPDFVLEVASLHTWRNDVTGKRDNYAAYEIPECWRFNPTGGHYYGAPLAGDRLVDGTYRPIEIVQVEEGRHWGHSATLGLDLCWEEGQLRWHDPSAQRYLRTFDEEVEERLAAEERIRELEAEVRRLQG